MKLKYTKPDFVMESFEMTQSIAASCYTNHVQPGSTLGDPNWADKRTCGWVVGGYTIWTATTAKCIDENGFGIIAGENDEIFGLCYNNPGGHNVIFVS